MGPNKKEKRIIAELRRAIKERYSSIYEAENHLQDLQETFKNLMRVNLKLKAEKCPFEVSEGKFLGYMITKEGIKPRFEKMQAIINMQAPKTIKDVKKLNGGVVALSWFIQKCTDKCRHFFKLLKNTKKTIKWDKNCDEYFQELKKALCSLPTLQAPKRGETLTLYVATSESAVNVFSF